MRGDHQSSAAARAEESRRFVAELERREREFEQKPFLIRAAHHLGEYVPTIPMRWRAWKAGVPHTLRHWRETPLECLSYVRTGQPEPYGKPLGLDSPLSRARWVAANCRPIFFPSNVGARMVSPER